MKELQILIFIATWLLLEYEMIIHTTPVGERIKCMRAIVESGNLVARAV